MGEKLNVATILEGSMRKEGQRVRVTAQLIKVADGFHLWSETYDRQLSDIFAVQDEIARSVAGSLKVALLGGGTATPSAQGTNAEAYNAHLQGRYFFERRSKENLEKAIGYYEQAIKLDSGYAPAWVGLAETRSLQGDQGYLPVEEGSGRPGRRRSGRCHWMRTWQRPTRRWGESRRTTTGTGRARMPPSRGHWPWSRRLPTV